jgi:Uma2 family endonuclease
MALTRVRHRFSVDVYEQMIDSGIFREDDPVELIRGEIIDKMPIGDGHAACVNRLTRLFVLSLGRSAIVSVQNPIRLADSEPEPDISLLIPRDDFYASGKPRPADILLLIEVADTSLDFDREVKLPLYAEAGIRELWIVNLEEDCLEVHRNPTPDVRYCDIAVLRRGQDVEIAALPGTRIAAADLL